MTALRRIVRATAFLAITAGTLVATGGIASAAPGVTVTPDTDLVDLQPVTVDGSGYTPFATIAMVQCVFPATGQDDCDLSNVQFTSADDTGAFTADFNVRRIITTANAGDVDCATAPGTCSLAAANLDNQTEASAAQLSFDPNVPPVPDLEVALSVDPKGSVIAKTGLVTVTGTITCSQPAEGFLDVIIRQRAGRAFIDGESFSEVTCGPTPTPWSASTTGFNGIFKAGNASVDAFAGVETESQSAFDEVVANVKLVGKRK